MPHKNLGFFRNHMKIGDNVERRFRAKEELFSSLTAASPNPNRPDNSFVFFCRDECLFCFKGIGFRLLPITARQSWLGFRRRTLYTYQMHTAYSVNDTE